MNVVDSLPFELWPKPTPIVGRPVFRVYSDVFGQVPPASVDIDPSQTTHYYWKDIYIPNGIVNYFT